MTLNSLRATIFSILPNNKKTKYPIHTQQKNNKDKNHFVTPKALGVKVFSKLPNKNNKKILKAIKGENTKITKKHFYYYNNKAQK
jgi:hypothetical protein